MHNDYADPKLNSYYNNVSPLPVCSGPPGLGPLSWSSTAASASTASSLATSGQLEVRLGPASHSHVGRYSCHQNQTESVYLFVNGNHIHNKQQPSTLHNHVSRNNLVSWRPLATPVLHLLGMEGVCTAVQVSILTTNCRLFIISSNFSCSSNSRPSMPDVEVTYMKCVDYAKCLKYSQDPAAVIPDSKSTKVEHDSRWVLHLADC